MTKDIRFGPVGQFRIHDFFVLFISLLASVQFGIPIVKIIETGKKNVANV